jgi:ATP diphosphatase
LNARRRCGKEIDMTTPTVSLDRLAGIMAALRHPETGCPWDLAQDFDTIAPYTIEEAYEVAEAIAQRDMAELKKELGDLLFQVVFHSRMAEEAGHFTLGDVVTALCEKMERRHPHIFGANEYGDGRRSASAEAQKAEWERIKAAERAAAGAAQHPVSALDGVASALPALVRAEKLQARAARVGFEWPDIAGVRAKLDEELAEFDAAADAAHRAEELGDVLFVLANLARRHGIDPEAALRAGNAKFERRFRAMEALAGPRFADLPLDEQERYWQRVKAAERA